MTCIVFCDNVDTRSCKQIRERLETLEQPRIVELDSDEGRAVDVRRRGGPPLADGDDVSDTTATTLNCLPANYIVMRD